MSILVRSDDDRALDPALTGAKFATLCRIARWPAADRPRLCQGAALTTDAWRLVVHHNSLEHLVQRASDGEPAAASELAAAFASVELPDQVLHAVASALPSLLAEGSGAIAVRSSAVVEDLEGRTFAGQFVTRLSVRELSDALAAYRDCLASAWRAGAVAYRSRTQGGGGTEGAGEPAAGGASEDPAMAVALQPMVHLGDGWAGAALSDGGGGVTVEVVRGLGDELMSGRADPLRWSVPRGEVADGVLVGSVVEWVRRAERRCGHAVEVEFALESEGSVPVVLQVRPNRPWVPHPTRADRWHQPTGEVNGLAVGSGTARGRVCRLDGPEQMDLLEPGAVLVTAATDPSWLPLLGGLAAVVTDHGGLTSHAAIVCRELGLLAVVGCGDATIRLAHGQLVEVRAEGAAGAVVAVG